MGLYNVTNLTAANNILEVTTAANQLTGGFLFPIILFLLYLIIIISSIGRNDIRKVLVASSLFIALIGFLGLALGLCEWWVILIPIIIFAGSLIALLIKPD